MSRRPPDAACKLHETGAIYPAELHARRQRRRNSSFWKSGGEGAASWGRAWIAEFAWWEGRDPWCLMAAPGGSSHMRMPTCPVGEVD